MVHNGYFSIDKKSKKSNSKEKFEYFKDTKGTTKADEDTYSLIMRDKEKLLSFDSKLRFIFSHSALKEGWDNPNVFQIEDVFLKMTSLKLELVIVLNIVQSVLRSETLFDLSN